MHGRRLKWTIAATGVIASCAALAPAHVAAACKPLPPIVTCPPPPPPPQPTTSAPTASITAASNVTYNTVALNATIDPGNLSTTYSWSLRDAAGRAPGQTVDGTIAAGSSPVSVTTAVSGLEPGTTYDVELDAYNTQGSAQPQRQTRAFTTKSTFTMILVRPKRNAAFIGGTFDAKVVLSGHYNHYAPLRLYVDSDEHRGWRLAGRADLRHGGLQTVRLAVCAGLDRCSTPGANFKLRVAYASKVSRTVREYVYPRISDYLTRERDGYSPWVDLVTEAAVHHLRTKLHSEPVYFYRGPGRHGPFRRIGVGRFHAAARYSSWTVLKAKIRFVDRGTGTGFGCIRHRLLRDMGKPFTIRWCGRRYLPRR